MKKKLIDYLVILLGLLLLATGLLLVRTLINPQGVLLVLPYILIGIGCGIFGHGAGNVISRKSMENHPEIQKQIAIDTNDERNVLIAYRAKSKAYDFMIFVFGALMLSFALMQIDLIATLLLVFAYLLVVAFGVYYRFKYEKEM